ncbi:hypothetical protein EUGRSUZ_G02232 [Eucalyptus grandis]|uniref:Uncharacterized protein n=2 Tax=Eucalyptus grandis TaxID=71139 RepID=A0ACC3K6A8_EUCGR|nr:hypothetical protein EUGRSUZ_G02232 [Eucalyptus grandis]
MVSSAYHDDMRRFWRKRRYQRLDPISKNRKMRTIRTTLKCRWLLKMVSPVNLLTKFHDAYIDVMIRLAAKVGYLSSGAGVIRGKRPAKSRQVCFMPNGEEVDTKLVMDIYKRIAASRDLQRF